jgi:hypothetical protein
MSRSARVQPDAWNAIRANRGILGQYRGLPTPVAKVLLVLGCGILCFIAQVRAADNASAPGILYSTTLINSDTTSSPPQVSAIALDAVGNGYVAGFIQSGGLQTTPGVVQPRYAGGSCQFSG